MKTGLIQVADTVCRDLRRRSTKAERLLWERLRNRAIEGVKFRRQHALFHELLGTDTFCVVDFCSAELRLAVELDGNIHDYRREQDGRRESIIGLLGVRVLRFKNEEVETRIDDVLTVLRGAIRELEPLSCTEKRR